MTDAERFLQHINDNYELVKTKLKMLCGRNKMKFDEDVYHESMIRCYNAIVKKGKLNDNSSYGIESYLIRSFFNLIKEMKRSAINSKRDNNINSDNINDVYEIWYNANNNTSRLKLLNDLWIDFATLYIMHKVEKEFDNEYFYLFKLKTLCALTYKQISNKTNIKSCRQKIISVKSWVKENIKKEEISAAFYAQYNNLI